MNETVRDDRQSVYEVGFLLAGIPEDRVQSETLAVREIITKNGGAVIAEEAPHLEQLAYTMRKKTVSGSYDKYDEGYFGWVKFEGLTDKADAIKKQIEAVPSVLRMLLITTIRENTYLGKRASQAISGLIRKPVASEEEIANAVKKPEVVEAPATIEEMDKSIDDMVKEV